MFGEIQIEFWVCDFDEGVVDVGVGLFDFWVMLAMDVMG